MNALIYVDIFYKYVKFWSISLDKKVDLKPLFSEECVVLFIKSVSLLIESYFSWRLLYYYCWHCSFSSWTNCHFLCCYFIIFNFVFKYILHYYHQLVPYVLRNFNLNVWVFFPPERNVVGLLKCFFCTNFLCKFFFL